MSVSGSSTEEAGYALINRLWTEIDRMRREIEMSTSPNKIVGYTPAAWGDVKQTLVFAAHRLAFLEMVTKGLTEMDKHDAQAYARFVEKKRKIEDLDLDELRVLLRERS